MLLLPPTPPTPGAVKGKLGMWGGFGWAWVGVRSSRRMSRGVGSGQVCQGLWGMVGEVGGCWE